MSTRGAVLVALAAAMGNLLQGWDNATIAGFSCYLMLMYFLNLCENGG